MAEHLENTQVNLRTVAERDMDAMQDVVERSSDYYELVEGHPPGPAEAHDIYVALPDDVDSYDNKLLLAISRADGSMIGLADIICDWPSEGAWIVGLLILVPEARGEGNGADALSQIEQRAFDAGAATMRAAVYRANTRGLAFWERNGYRPIREDHTSDPIVLTRRLTD